MNPNQNIPPNVRSTIHSQPAPDSDPKEATEAALSHEQNSLGTDSRVGQSHDPGPRSDSFFEVGEAWTAEQTRKSELVAAVREIENKSTGGLTKFIVLLFSLTVFIAAGVAWWDPWVVSMLVIILLFHEAGHYLAMRMFGYRNVKMFFIPFLGAAVSGRHFNISGWKKALVYLAGPVPGILVSLPIMAAGIATDRQWMLELGGMGLLLNLLNLLPIMPLDGGWIMHLTVFCRSPLLELAARLLGIAAMFAFAYFAGSSFILLIAIPLVLSLPTSYRIAKLIGRLRDRRLPQPERDEIPDAAIRLLDDEIQTSPLAPTPTANKAAIIVQMYESLIVRPPGVVATLAIWAIYGAAFVIAIVGGFGILISRDLLNSGIFDRDMFDSQQQIVRLDVEATEFKLGDAPIEHSYLAVARFDSAAELEVATQELRKVDLDHYSHARFGNVWLASIPRPTQHIIDPDDEQAEKEFANAMGDEQPMHDRIRTMLRPVDPGQTWIAKIAANSTRQGNPPEQERDFGEASADDHEQQPLPGQPIVHVVSGLHHSSIQIRATAPTAQIAESVVTEFFQMPGIGGKRLYLPPWSPLAPPTPQQIQCRNVLKHLMDGITPETSPELWAEKQAIEKEQMSQHIDGNFDPTTAAILAARIRDLEARHTADAIETLSGEQAEVARMYQNYQNAAAKFRAKTEQRALQARARLDAGKPLASDSQEPDELDDYPLLDDFLIDDANLLGFADPAEKSQHYAAHVTGSVLSAADLAAERMDEPAVTRNNEAGQTGGRVVNLFVHRAADQVATVSAVVAFLQQLGFDSFELWYVTPTTSSD